MSIRFAFAALCVKGGGARSRKSLPKKLLFRLEGADGAQFFSSGRQSAEMRQEDEYREGLGYIEKHSDFGSRPPL